MAKANRKLKPKYLVGLKGKLLLWLISYLNSSDSSTFMNGAGSARKAKYKGDDHQLGVIGSQNLAKLRDRINQWMEEAGLTESVLKQKLVSLMSAKETKLIKLKGDIIEEDLPDNCTIIAKTSQTKRAGKNAVAYKEEHTLIAVNREALGIQQKSLDMGMRHKGMYKDELIITGLEELGKRLNQAHKRENGDGSNT